MCFKVLLFGFQNKKVFMVKNNILTAQLFVDWWVCVSKLLDIITCIDNR